MCLNDPDRKPSLLRTAPSSSTCVCGQLAMSPADFNTHTDEGHSAKSKMPQISSQLSKTFNLRASSKPAPRHKKSAPALATINASKGEYDEIRPAMPAPLKTTKSGKTDVTQDQMIQFIKRENRRLQDEREYHIQLLGASDRLLEVANRCAEELKNGVLEFKETQNRLNEEYYSVTRRRER